MPPGRLNGRLLSEERYAPLNVGFWVEQTSTRSASYKSIRDVNVRSRTVPSTGDLIRHHKSNATFKDSLAGVNRSSSVQADWLMERRNEKSEFEQRTITAKLGF